MTCHTWQAKKTASFSSVGKRFVNDLNSLLTDLQASRASFIRCIKPNLEQAIATGRPRVAIECH